MLLLAGQALNISNTLYISSRTHVAFPLASSQTYLLMIRCMKVVVPSSALTVTTPNPVSETLALLCALHNRPDFSSDNLHIVCLSL